MIEITVILIFALFVLIGASVFIFLKNRNVKTYADSFSSKTIGLSYIVLKDIKLEHLETTGLYTSVSLFNFCDIHLFENFIVVFRRQHLLVKIRFSPFIVSNDIEKTKKIYQGFDIYKAEEIKIVRSNSNQGIIKVTVRANYNKNVTIKFCLIKLTDEQIDKLEKIKNWVIS